MADNIVKFVGKRQPPLFATIMTDTTDDPLPVGATVTFSMRASGSTTLKVNAAAATVVSEPNNTVRYDWAAVDVDTAGDYIAWWTVTISGQTQDTPEFVIRILAHAPETNTYLEVEEIKSTLEIDSQHADEDLRTALVAASRVIDEITATRFYSTAADEVRYYTPDTSWRVFTDEINAITELATDDSGGTSFATVWSANTDYILEPLNATVGATQIRPWDRIKAHRGRSFPAYERSVRVTGKFGWATPPEAVKVATSIIATKILRRARSAPMGIMTAFDGTAIRMSRFDPQLDELLSPYNRSTPFG